MKLNFSLIVCSLCITLAACGSNVKLDDVPVENRSTPPVQSSSGGSITPDTRGIAPVQADAAGINQPGPANTPRIIYFDFDSFVIKSEFQNVIEANSRFLSANRSRVISVEGHTDDKGGREYNLALGQKRAETVRRSMALLGVLDSQMEAVSFGKEKPSAIGSDEASMAKNRRVEISYR